MRDDYIYVHLESLVNLIYSRGILAEDFLHGVLQAPTNILLLNGETDDRMVVDNHTLLNVIKDPHEIEDYMTKEENLPKWIDFTQSEALSDLTPEDIAELLYMGHMYSHLKTPYSYKLQNDFVYLTVGAGQTKTYYRRLKNFYSVLNVAILRHVNQVYRERRFFRRPIKFNEIPQSMIRQLIPILGEGIIFAFDQILEVNQQYQIPILIVSDSDLAPTLRSRESLYHDSKKVAVLKYNFKSGHWHLVITDPHAFEVDALY